MSAPVETHWAITDTALSTRWYGCIDPLAAAAGNALVLHEKDVKAAGGEFGRAVLLEEDRSDSGARYFKWISEPCASSS